MGKKKLLKAKEKPLLTTKQKKRRLLWAKERKNWVQRQWNNVIWSDEARFEITVGSQHLKVVRRKNEAFRPDCLKRVVKFPASLMVWGCMSAHGVGRLHIVDGIVNANKYIDILENHLLPSISELERNNQEYIFQQDGAPCHTAKVVKAWFTEKNISVLDWPSSSPDLSPIETLWGIMKKNLAKNPATTKEELKVRLQEIWAQFDTDFCQNLVNTMHKRLNAVINNKGEATQY